MFSIPQWLPVSVSLVSTTLALIAFSYQVHRARFNQSVDLLFKLESDFFGKNKIEQRAKAAENLLQNPEDFSETEDILDFFETVAMLTRRKALDKYVVWHTFDYWIERYVAVAASHIADRQQRDPGVWEDLAWLVPQLRQMQSRKNGPQSVQYTPAELQRFLREEASEN